MRLGVHRDLVDKVNAESLCDHSSMYQTKTVQTPQGFVSGGDGGKKEMIVIWLGFHATRDETWQAATSETRKAKAIDQTNRDPGSNYTSREMHAPGCGGACQLGVSEPEVELERLL